MHRTHSRGEGLVGPIADQAEPMHFADAQSHPAFSYRPETGEEIFHSFLGVPILRAGTPRRAGRAEPHLASSTATRRSRPSRRPRW